MKVNTIRISSPSRELVVEVQRKSVKKVRLKVFPDGRIKLAAPESVTEKWIDVYLNSKTAWIEKSLDYFEETRANELETFIRSGVSTRILGRQVRIIVRQAKRNRIDRREDHIYLHSVYNDDSEALQKQFERWWQIKCKGYFGECIDKLYPIIAKYGQAKPTLQVRKMKTLWGSCSRKRQKINLNYYLYKASPPCIEYVVLHELTHFLYPKHNKDFYEFLTIHMPDWKERKRILDHEVVRGLRY